MIYKYYYGRKTLRNKMKLDKSMLMNGAFMLFRMVVKSWILQIGSSLEISFVHFFQISQNVSHSRYGYDKG